MLTTIVWVLVLGAAAVLAYGIVRDLWYRASLPRHDPRDAYHYDCWKK